MKKLTRLIVLTTTLILTLNSCKNPAESKDLEIWYKNPAKEWVEALPLGNGRLGAMVYGGVNEELIRLNEETLWSGQPVDHNPNPSAIEYLEQTRQALLNNDHDLANQLCRKMQGYYTESYMPLGDIRIKYDFGSDTEPTTYRRSLNISDAIQTTEFEIDGVKYTREAFISAPDQALFVKLTADKPGALNFSTGISSKLNNVVKSEDNSILLTGMAPVHVEPNYVNHPEPVIYEKDGKKGMRFAAQLKIDTKGGSVKASENGEGLTVEGADEALIVLSAATSFNGFDHQPFDEGIDEIAALNEYMNLSAGKSYEKIKNNHIADYKKYFDRVSFDLVTDEDKSDKDTFERLVSYAGGDSDLDLEETYYQFGRYLLISCSRPDNKCSANLQGIWNHHLRAPWSSNYTTNINAQMNYWPAEATNLSELHQPFINQIKNMAENGKQTAKNFYGADGWALSHNSDIWAQTNPVGNKGDGDPMWANWYMGSPWVSQHLFDHYRYTGDIDFLREEAYPIMKGAAQFCEDWLFDDGTGTLVTAPSTSPENTYRDEDGNRHFISIASTMDMSLIYDIFTNVIEASEILDIDHDFAQALKEKRAKLSPLQIGEKGNLQEWWKDYEDVDPHHRHVSHLICLHPGRQVSPFKTPEFADASKQTLLMRGDDGTGWSVAWKINFWARLLDGNHSYKLVRNLLRIVTTQVEEYNKGGGTYANLFCAHPPFQIDGNFGGLAGMTEMLIQSHEDVVHMLPALPDAWAKGNIKGLRARNGFEVDMAWEEGTLANAQIKSLNGNDCVIRTNVPVTIKGAKAESQLQETSYGNYYLTSFKTKPGKTYQVIKN